MPAANSTLARILAYVTWLSWMVLFAGSHYLPELFENPKAAIPLLGVVGLGAPLTVLFGIRYAMHNGRWRISCLLILFGAIPLCVTVGNSGLNLLRVDQISVFMWEVDYKVQPPKDGRMDQARDGNLKVEDRRTAPWAVYFHWGIRIMWLNEEGELVPFEPSEEDLRMRADRLALDAMGRESEGQLLRASHRSRAIFVFQVGLFLAVLIPGLIILCRRARLP